MCPSQPNYGPTGDLPVPDMLCKDLSARPLAGPGQQARLGHLHNLVDIVVVSGLPASSEG